MFHNNNLLNQHKKRERETGKIFTMATKTINIKYITKDMIWTVATVAVVLEETIL